MGNDLELEAFLRRFRPLGPKPLPRRPRPRIAAWVGLAAVLAFLALTGAWWSRVRTAPDKASPFAAARASLDDPARLASLLDAESRRLLADVRNRDGALRDLAALERDR